jgi:hypothetical protein
MEWHTARAQMASLKRALKVTSPFYICSLIVGFIFAVLFPGPSQSFVGFTQKGTIGGALVTPFLESKNPLIIGSSIFLVNFVIGGFGRFVLLPILLYQVAFFLAVSVSFLMGFVIGSPTSLSYLSDFSSFGSILLMLMFVFENLGFITACAIGYEIGKESQEGLTTREYLMLLIVLVHLKDAKRRETIRKGLSANIPWILLSMIFIILGAFFETWLLVHFR